jgi:hypothetical protein
MRQLLFTCLLGCATLAAEGKGDVDLPNTLTGPFRALKRAKTCDGDVCTGVNELPAGVANGVLAYPGNPPSKSPSALVLGGTRVAMYVAQTDKIVRLESEDARTFTNPVAVINEMGATDPCAIAFAGSVWLYYGTPTGLRVAQSSDGVSFAAGKNVLVNGETEAARAPGVYRVANGTFHLFYGAGKSIAEATSNDGTTFTRVGVAVVPSNPVDPLTLPEGVRLPFDDDSVDDPWIDRIVTESGRSQWLLHYTGRDRRGGSSVGFAGRFGDTGAFEKREGFVFGGKLFGDPDGNSHANAPTVARFADFALIYANFDVDKAQKIGIGIAPQRKLLPIDE